MTKNGKPLGMSSPVELPKLPFADTALEPIISANTLSFHHGKHHKAYVDNLTKLIAGTDLEGKDLETIIAAVANKPEKQGVFNNAAQVWNHNFYWLSLAPKGKAQPTAKVEELVKGSFENLDALKKALTDAAVSQFGSGWAWLVLKGDKVEIAKTSNAMVPWLDGEKPLLTLDVWEHAYYLDYQNRRPDYLKAVLDNLVNWEFVLENAAK